jgi:hypothetical protein
MNKCDLAGSDFSVASKIAVLDAAISEGLSIDLNYFELYEVDINDADLNSFLTQKSIDVLNHWQDNRPESQPTVLSLDLIDNCFIEVYPNPFTNYIAINGDMKDFEISIFNQFGQIIYSLPNLQTPCFLDLNHLNNGIYFMKISGLSNVTLSGIKIIKE